MGRWTKGRSGNPKGRPRKGTAIADLARSQIQKHKLIEELGRIAIGDGTCSGLGFDQRLRAIQLLLAYGYGPPRPEVDTNEKLVIEVNYVDKNPVAVTKSAPRTITNTSNP